VASAPAGLRQPTLSRACLWIHVGGIVIGKTAQADDALCRRVSAGSWGSTVGRRGTTGWRRSSPTPPVDDCFRADLSEPAVPAFDPPVADRRGSAWRLAVRSAGHWLAALTAASDAALQLLSTLPMPMTRKWNWADNPHYRLWAAESNRFRWKA